MSLPPPEGVSEEDRGRPEPVFVGFFGGTLSGGRPEGVAPVWRRLRMLSRQARSGGLPSGVDGVFVMVDPGFKDYLGVREVHTGPAHTRMQRKNAIW